MGVCDDEPETTSGHFRGAPADKPNPLSQTHLSPVWACTGLAGVAENRELLGKGFAGVRVGAALRLW